MNQGFFKVESNSQSSSDEPMILQPAKKGCLIDFITVFFGFLCGVAVGFVYYFYPMDLNAIKYAY